MERDLRLVRFRLYNLDISTHTLTWSVTRRIKSIIKLIYISTHTLTWSVTTSAVMSLICLSFQLTRSRGAWRWFNGSIRSTKKFQLTRSRGAWLCRITFTWKIYLNFNSHAHVERDVLNSLRKRQESFQLTRSRGAWLRATNECSWHKNFNSHAHVERDPKSACPCQQHFHFNSHAHVERDVLASPL